MKNYSSYSFRPLSGGRVEVYQYGSLREVWHPWWEGLRVDLLRGQKESDFPIREAAIGSAPEFAGWRATIPPVFFDLAPVVQEREIEYLQLASVKPLEMLRHASERPAVAWLLADEWHRREPRDRPEVVRAAGARFARIADLLGVGGGAAGLRVLAKLPPELCYHTAIEGMLLALVSTHSRRVAAHYRRKWTLDVIRTLQLGAPYVSNGLLHLAAQSGEDRSVRALAIDVRDALGRWPYGRLPETLEKWEANIARSVEKRFRDVRFPAPPLPPPPWGSVVSTPAELKRLALQFRNCVWIYHEALRDGEASIYYASREEMGQDIAWVVESTKDGPSLADMAGADNQIAEKHCREAIEEWFRKGGRP